MKKRSIIIACLGIIVILFIIILALILLFRNSSSPSDQEESDTMTFEVTIPSNTYPDDTIYIYLPGNSKYKMQKKEDFVYSIIITQEQLDLENGMVRYRYSRNGDNFITAEYLEPDTNDYFWTELGRKVEYQPGKIQIDTISRWRWFPENDIPIESTSDITHTSTFLPRINDIEFRSGQIIEDLYTDSFDEFFSSTALHMKDIGYTWVEIDPPWQWTDENGLPKVKNLYKENPNYPSDEKFLEEVEAYKEQGLKVAIQPQLCCTELSTENRSSLWWNAYFSETKKFLLHFADLAEKANADSIHYAVGSWDFEFEDKWRDIFSTIKEHFSGEVGQMVWNFGANTGQIIPTADQIPWGNELDYFYIAIDAPISRKSNPTDEELKAGADTMLDGVKQLYDTFGKPVFVRTTYFAVKETWRGNSYYSIADVPSTSASEQELTDSKYSYKPEDQARVINAYFRSIAERPWILGYAQFGYTHWVNPLNPELSVREKPAEDVWRKWNKAIFQ